jgi:hypothetical protein
VGRAGAQGGEVQVVGRPHLDWQPLAMGEDECQIVVKIGELLALVQLRQNLRRAKELACHAGHTWAPLRVYLRSFRATPFVAATRAPHLRLVGPRLLKVGEQGAYLVHPLLVGSPRTARHWNLQARAWNPARQAPQPARSVNLHVLPKQRPLVQLHSCR